MISPALNAAMMQATIGLQRAQKQQLDLGFRAQQMASQGALRFASAPMGQNNADGPAATPADSFKAAAPAIAELGQQDKKFSILAIFSSTWQKFYSAMLNGLKRMFGRKEAEVAQSGLNKVA